MKALTPVLATLLALAGCTGEPLESPDARAGFASGRPLDHRIPTPPEAVTALETPRPAAAPRPAGAMEVFPHVRVDRDAGTVEIDGVVAVDTHDAATPRVYLEVLVCTPDTREHEALVVTRARPSHVHAALLMLDLQPGAPGGFDWSGKTVAPIAPKGPAVRVAFRTTASGEQDPWSWVTVLGPGGAESRAAPEGRFVFAGSRFAKRTDPATGEAREVYDADGAGTLVGLTTFGSETIAWSTVWSPDSAIQEPAWIARGEQVPAVGTPVTVIIRTR